MCIGIIWNNSFLVGGHARAEAQIDPRPLRTSRSTAYGAQVAWPLDYNGRASTIEKKLVKEQYLLHTSLQYGELQPTNGWDWLVGLGHPTVFQWVSRLAALLHGTLLVGVSQTLQRWTEGATYIQLGDHNVGHWPTFLVITIMTICTAALFYPATRS